MATFEKEFDLKQDKQDEHIADAQHEINMRNDVGLAIENYSSYETLIVAFKGLSNHLDMLGHELSNDEVFELFKESL